MKKKKIPERKCIACNSRDAKKSLLRIVKNKDGEIFIDPTNKANGRGAYVCATKECLTNAIKTKALNRAFKIDVDDSVYDELLKELNNYNDEN